MCCRLLPRSCVAGTDVLAEANGGLSTSPPALLLSNFLLLANLLIALWKRNKMPLPGKPTTVIVPVVTVVAGTTKVYNFVGYCFLGRVGSLYECETCLRYRCPARGEALAVVLFGGSGAEPIPVPARLIYSDPIRDVAVARVDDWPRSDGLTLAPDNQLAMNTDILTIEYSEPDRGILLEDGQSAIGIGPNWHKGYMVREYVDRFGQQRPTACLDLSFPALKGASGAPAVDGQTGLVLGMIVGNVERVLLPTQIAPVLRNKVIVDEVRYFAPYAQAICARYLREALETFSATAEGASGGGAPAPG